MGMAGAGGVGGSRPAGRSARDPVPSPACARSAPPSASQVVGELDLPASRGCCASAATPATAALRRRRRAREAAPRESRAAGAGAAAGDYRIYRGRGRTLGGGSLRALPYLPGAAQALSGGGEAAT